MCVHINMPVCRCYMYVYLQSNVSADGAAQCYIRDPRTPPVQCGNYSTSHSDYVLTHLAPHISKPSFYNIMLVSEHMCVPNSTDGMYLPLISNAVPQLSSVYDSECKHSVPLHTHLVYTVTVSPAYSMNEREWWFRVCPP